MTTKMKTTTLNMRINQSINQSINLYLSQARAHKHIHAHTHTHTTPHTHAHNMQLQYSIKKRRIENDGSQNGIFPARTWRWRTGRSRVGAGSSTRCLQSQRTGRPHPRLDWTASVTPAHSRTGSRTERTWRLEGQGRQ